MTHQAPLGQWIRPSVFETECWEFESLMERILGYRIIVIHFSDKEESVEHNHLSQHIVPWRNGSASLLHRFGGGSIPPGTTKP